MIFGEIPRKFHQIGEKINENYLKIAIFQKIHEKMRKSFTKFCWDFHFQPVQRNVNLVDLEKCWKMRIWTQKSASIQKRTSPLKFDNFAEKSEKDTVSIGIVSFI